MRRGPLFAIAGAALALVLAADQASKWWVLDSLGLQLGDSVPVLPVFSLTLVHNPGVTFGLLRQDGAAGPLVLAAVALAVVAALGLWLRRAETRLVAGALGAIAGGAVGNVIDRLRFGWVTDFLHAHYAGWSFYVFNLGDAAIVCGVAALLLDGLRTRSPAPPKAPGLRAPGPPD